MWFSLFLILFLIINDSHVLTLQVTLYKLNSAAALIRVNTVYYYSSQFGRNFPCIEKILQKNITSEIHLFCKKICKLFIDEKFPLKKKLKRPRRYRKYSLEDRDKATQLVLDGTLTPNQANKQFGIPQSTIFDMIKRGI